MVAAAVAATDTTTDPATGPKMTPAVIVSGTAGTARISSSMYTPPYARYLAVRQLHMVSLLGFHVSSSMYMPPYAGYLGGPPFE